MKRYAWIAGALLIVVLLVAAEMAVISKATEINIKGKAVFARVKINKNTVIGKEMLELREVSADAIHPEALKDMDTAVSKIACMDIEPGEMLLKPKLSSGKRGIIEAEDKSRRLFTVEFKGDQANGWQLTAGQLVDIIYVPHDKITKNNTPEQAGIEGKVESENGKELETEVKSEGKAGITINESVAGKSETESEIVAGPETIMEALSEGQVKILKNIRIAGLIDENGKLLEISDEKGTPRYISFEVTSWQACFLTYAKKYGQLEISSISE